MLMLEEKCQAVARYKWCICCVCCGISHGGWVIDLCERIRAATERTIKNLSWIDFE